MGKRGLGRGLSALIATGENVGGLKFEELPVSAIRPNSRQPRSSFPEAGIRELAASIQEVGILQPLVVRPTPGGFELIAGERRLRAAKEAGLERVPVLIRQAGEDESMELALVENLQRENLSPLETAAAYQALMDGFGLTKERLARRLGKSRAAVTNTLRLVQLPEGIQALLGDGKLSEGHARALLGLQTEEQMTRLAQKVGAEKLSVRRTEELVRELLGSPGETSHATPQQGSTTPDEFHEASRRMREALELPVRVKSLRSGGKVEIRFRQTEELEALVSLLTAQNDG
ncbi:MAG: ParB/RepB/Spo0J family partition protein [Actinomycetota bacterium]|nr:ParB/RepB/Spo0J family partition protein [Actinomycetota bacterium]